MFLCLGVQHVVVTRVHDVVCQILLSVNNRHAGGQGILIGWVELGLGLGWVCLVCLLVSWLIGWLVGAAIIHPISCRSIPLGQSHTVAIQPLATCSKDASGPSPEARQWDVVPIK